MLTVETAAVKDRDGKVHSLPRPARHHTILHAMSEAGAPSWGEEQGFLLSDGRFVGRKAAANIAIKSGQIKALRWPPNLYSEDLW